MCVIAKVCVLFFFPPDQEEEDGEEETDIDCANCANCCRSIEVAVNKRCKRCWLMYKGSRCQEVLAVREK